MGDRAIRLGPSARVSVPVVVPEAGAVAMVALAARVVMQLLGGVHGGRDNNQGVGGAVPDDDL